MNGTLSQGSWRIGTIMGIPIRVHFLMVYHLWFDYLVSLDVLLPPAAPDLPAASYWVKGVLAALLLFASVGFHELAHSFVAKKYKIPIESITLFIFGGVAQMKGEPPHPKANSGSQLPALFRAFFPFRPVLFPVDERRRREQGPFFLSCADKFYHRGVQSHSRFPDGRRQGAEVRNLEEEKGLFARPRRRRASGKRSPCFSFFRALLHFYPDAGWIVADVHRVVPLHRRPGQAISSPPFRRACRESESGTSW